MGERPVQPIPSDASGEGFRMVGAVPTSSQVLGGRRLARRIIVSYQTGGFLSSSSHPPAMGLPLHLIDRPEEWALESANLVALRVISLSVLPPHPMN